MKTIATLLLILGLASAIGCAHVPAQQSVYEECSGWNRGDGCQGWNY